VTLYLVRHAKATSRSRWDGPDDLRPLTKHGRVQADGLIDVLADRGITHIVSSPSVRCRQTVEPLGEILRLPVELADALAEGAPVVDGVRLAEKFGDEHSVLCSHGDVIPELLAHLESKGVDLGPEPRCEKGSTWVVDVRGGEPRGAHYLPPPTG